MSIRLVNTAYFSLLLYGGTAWAQIAPAQQKLEGAWVALITRVNPAPGVVPTFYSLHSYLAGGGYIETSSTGRTLRSPAFGEWIRTGNRQFTITQYTFRFGPNEQYIGTSRIIRNIRLSENGTEFTGVSTADQFDTEGKLTATGIRATESGRRLDVGEFADQP